MPAATFADVLDHLAGSGATPSSSTAPVAAGIFTAPLAGSPLAVPRAAFARMAPLPRRPARRLTPRQRAALDLLRGTGSPWLSEDFTNAELKTAFRRAARLVHPDAHPHAANHATLAGRFHEIREAFEALRPVTP